MTTIPDDVGQQVRRPDVDVHSAGTAPGWLTGYLTDYWNEHPEDTPVSAGTVVGTPEGATGRRDVVPRRPPALR